MIGTLIQKGSRVRNYLLPFSVGGITLTVAILGSIATGDDNSNGGINGFVEGLSGRSSSSLGGIGFLAPLGFAFAAGMVATVNPCGFAMLPAYLGLYIGFNDSKIVAATTIQKLARALLVGLVVTSGFVILFGLTGIVIAVGARSIVQYIPWIGLSIGIILAIAGSWLLGGGKIYSGIAVKAASHIGTSGQVGVKGYFLFGLGYGTASLSCTLPIFLSVIGVSFAASEIATSIGQFILYALGMGLVIVIMTLGMAVFEETMVGLVRKTRRFVQPVSALFMIVSGSYIVYYWLTIGRELL